MDKIKTIMYEAKGNNIAFDFKNFLSKNIEIFKSKKKGNNKIIIREKAHLKIFSNPISSDTFSKGSSYSERKATSEISPDSTIDIKSFDTSSGKISPERFIIK